MSTIATSTVPASTAPASTAPASTVPASKAAETTLPPTATTITRPVRPGSVVGATVRRLLWRAAFSLSGGLERDGRLPSGGCVVVANHSSHADTPALLAGLDAAHAPRVAAAADYWFSRPTRGRFCRAAVAGFPVRRTGGGFADLAAAGGVLDTGGAVVVFPSGSRDADARACHAGAFRLAAAHGVPVVPVGLAGTADVLAKSGGLHRARVSVRIGAPVAVDAADLEPSKRAVGAALADLTRPTDPGDDRVAVRDSRARARIAAYAVTPRAGVMMFLAALAEAMSWPLLPEISLAVLLLAGPPAAGRVAARLVTCALLGSVLGGLATAVLARHGVLLVQPLTTPAMATAVQSAYAQHGALGVWAQPWSGIPFKVFARAAGQSSLGLGGWIVQAGLARGSRMVAVAILAVAGARLIARRPSRYPVALAAGLVVFVPAFATVVAAWG